ncbi:hypothetical protein DFP72DRAFT_900327, partial [Ephemerocybe angulata]
MAETVSSSVHRVLNTGELATMIFLFLKDITRKAHGIDLSLDENKTVYQDWRKSVVLLATVNRAFSYACADAIWEAMDDMEPFMSLLRPSMQQDEDSVSLSYDNGITEEAWKRFLFYSSRTKTLVLTDLETTAETTLDPSWVLYMATAPNRPKVLFPALKRLVISTDDELSTYIALSTCHRAETILVDIIDKKEDFRLEENNGHLVESEAVVALTSALAQDPGRLRRLEVRYPVDPQIINNISRITTVKALRMHIWTGGAAQIAPIAQMQLENLCITIDRDSVDAVPSLDTGALEKLVKSKQNLMPHLSELLVKSNGVGQALALATITPNSLKVLKLELFYDSDVNKRLLGAFVAAGHMGRNPGMIIFHLNGHPVPEDQDELPSLPDPEDAFIDWTPCFMKHLATLRNVIYVEVTKVPFASTDVLQHLLKLLPDLKKLVKLRFLPEPVSALPEHQFAYLTLADLKRVAKHNPQLVDLTTYIDVRQLNILPDISKYRYPHKMKALKLVPHRESLPVWTTEQSLVVSQFLDRLFPALQSMSQGWTKSYDDCRRFWIPVEQMMRSHQLIRAQTIRDIEHKRRAS